MAAAAVAASKSISSLSSCSSINTIDGSSLDALTIAEGVANWVTSLHWPFMESSPTDLRVRDWSVSVGGSSNSGESPFDGKKHGTIVATRGALLRRSLPPLYSAPGAVKAAEDRTFALVVPSWIPRHLRHCRGDLSSSLCPRRRSNCSITAEL